jgi:hypothetical protein
MILALSELWNRGVMLRHGSVVVWVQVAQMTGWSLCLVIPHIRQECPDAAKLAQQSERGKRCDVNEYLYYQLYQWRIFGFYSFLCGNAFHSYINKRINKQKYRKCWKSRNFGVLSILINVLKTIYMCIGLLHLHVGPNKKYTRYVRFRWPQILK